MIVQIVTKSGRVMNVHAFHKSSISIGRGYHNDLILHDPYVDVEHLEVTAEPETGEFIVRDLNSLNGTALARDRGKKDLEGSMSLQSGTILSLGKTYIRILDKQYPLSPAMKLSVLEPVFTTISDWRTTFLASLMLAALTLLSTYWDNPHSDKILKELINIVFYLVVAFIYGGVWLLAARLNGREGRLLFNTNLVLLLLVLDLVLQLCLPVYEFNFGWLISGHSLMMFLSLLLSSSVLYISMTQTLHARRWIATGIALLIGFLFIAQDFNRSLFPPDFVRSPTYDMTLVSPKFQFRSALSEAEFVERVSSESFQRYEEPEE